MQSYAKLHILPEGREPLIFAHEYQWKMKRGIRRTLYRLFGQMNTLTVLTSRMDLNHVSKGTGYFYTSDILYGVFK
jgi:hypothetical protein